MVGRFEFGDLNNNFGAIDGLERHLFAYQLIQ